MPSACGSRGVSVRALVLLLTSDERMLLSPLSVDLRYFTSGLGVGVELQYIGAPEAGDEDVPAEGFACILRLGTGHGGHP